MIITKEKKETCVSESWQVCQQNDYCTGKLLSTVYKGNQTGMLVLESYFRHQQLYYSTRFLVLLSKRKKKSLLVTGCGTTNVSFVPKRQDSPDCFELHAAERWGRASGVCGDRTIQQQGVCVCVFCGKHNSIFKETFLLHSQAWAWFDSCKQRISVSSTWLILRNVFQFSLLKLSNVKAWPC